jgi:hypothetical protein
MLLIISFSFSRLAYLGPMSRESFGTSSNTTNCYNLPHTADITSRFGDVFHFSLARFAGCFTICFIPCFTYPFHMLFHLQHTSIRLFHPTMFYWYLPFSLLGFL